MSACGKCASFGRQAIEARHSTRTRLHSLCTVARRCTFEPMPDRLKGKIAIVAGASRGCGRGIAVALGEQAATVYVTGRSIRGGPPPIDRISGTIEETAEEVTRRGGVGIPLQIDHAH